MGETRTKTAGRRPLDPQHPSVLVTVRVDEHTYDALFASAQRERTTVSAVIRRALEMAARSGDNDDDDE